MYVGAELGVCERVVLRDAAVSVWYSSLVIYCCWILVAMSFGDVTCVSMPGLTICVLSADAWVRLAFMLRAIARWAHEHLFSKIRRLLAENLNGLPGGESLRCRRLGCLLLGLAGDLSVAQ
jgi:hypothetical protein